MPLRTLIELANHLLSRMKAGRRIHLPGNISSIKLNLGCGLAVAADWVNIDGSLNALVANMPPMAHRMVYRLTGARQYYSEQEYCSLLKNHRFLHHDLATGIPLPDGIADYIFSSHFLEHLFWRDANSLLRECHRVLKPGGVLRISVPDLEYALSLYAAGQKENMLRSYFFVEDENSFYARHKYMYDFDMLEAQLRDIGFVQVTRCQYREGNCPDIDVLDNRPEESLFVEALK
jgi:SAM-dependent methyltransferase